MSRTGQGFISVTCMCFLAVVAGCGGAGQDAANHLTGSAAVHIQATKGANSAVVRVFQGGEELADLRTVITREGSEGSTRHVISGIPPAETVFQAALYSSADGTGSALDRGTSTVQIQAGRTATVNIAFDGGVDDIPPPPFGTVILSDDFDDNDISDWFVGIPSGDELSEPTVSDGILTGVGQGYNDPRPGGAISKAVSFGAGHLLEVSLRAVSGPEWPNATRIRLTASDFGSHEWDGYQFVVYGEGFKRFDILKHRDGDKEFLGQFPLGTAVHEWHDYRVTRDAEGNWSLYIDDAVESGARFDSDMTFTEFTHVTLVLQRDQSKCDWLAIDGTD